MSGCADLIGMPYRLGADGSDGHIDCIHLCYEVWGQVGGKVPPFKQSWYKASKWEVSRDLLKWGFRVKKAEYDGDILLLSQQYWAFAVTGQTGILYVNRGIGAVQWSSVHLLTTYHC